MAILFWVVSKRSLILVFLPTDYLYIKTCIFTITDHHRDTTKGIRWQGRYSRLLLRREGARACYIWRPHRSSVQYWLLHMTSTENLRQLELSTKYFCSFILGGKTRGKKTRPQKCCDYFNRIQLYNAAVWCGVVWCGVVWCGVVWCGVMWCGIVWCGVV